MMNWTDAWWQARQSWAYFRHAYRCGWNLYTDVTDIADGWTQHGFSVAYAVVQAAPHTRATSIRG